MKYWGRGVPEWPRLLKQLINKRDILSYPGSPGVLKWLDIDKLVINDVPGLNWHCNGLYEVEVNNGGFIAEEPLELSNNSTAPMYSLMPWSQLEELGRWLSAKNEYYMNILGWKPLSPIRSTSPLPRCIVFEGEMWGKIDAQPLNSQSTDSCVKPKPIGTTEHIKLGPFIIDPGQTLTKYSSKGLVGYSSVIGDIMGCSTGNSLTISTESRSNVIVIRHNFYDYDIKLLYPLIFKRLGRVRSTLHASSNAIVVSTLQGSLALSSPNGVSVEASQGKLVVEFGDRITLTLGDTVQAYRTLIEQTIAWRPVNAPSIGYGHIRSGTSSPVLVDAGPGYLEFIVQNPSPTDSIVEVKLFYPVKSVTLSSPLGDLTLPHEHGLFRIPAPSCCICIVRVEFKRMLSRLRLISGK
ncbi:MAG: hypothetical protein GSR85_07080 [Desulfurococcales archaeon]|nr:hypothetical protein [Desulfurococcales archaeon]